MSLGTLPRLQLQLFFCVCVTCTLFEYLMFWSWFSCLLLICSFIHRVIPKALMPIEVCGFSSLQDLFMVW